MFAALGASSSESSSESMRAIGLGVGRRNRLAMRELADELRDDGDKGAGRRDREKKLRKKEKKLRKKEEREKPERERERE